MISLLPLALLAAQAVPSKPTVQADPPLPAFKVKVGDLAPDFTVEAPDGKTLKLSGFRGKVVVLDFWATWCGPCQMAMPKVQKAYDRAKEGDVVVLAVNVWDERPAFDKWIKENAGSKYAFTFGYEKSSRADKRKSSFAKQLYGVFGIPAVFVIGKDGRIVATMLGVRPNEEDELVETFRQLGVKTAR